MPAIGGLAEAALRLLYILLGFSLIIFLHELGHFVVARLCSVKCLAFSLGIGPRLFGWRKGGKLTFGNDPYDPETIAKQAPRKSGRRQNAENGEAVASRKHPVNPNESDLQTTAREPQHPASVGDCDYRVSWLPLGGYVRMLGQDDMDPTKVSNDPHAFNQRPIWQRMCIVSAGVMMNIIFAAVSFSIIFHPAIGVDFPPAFVGQVHIDSPAWKAASDGRRDCPDQRQKARGLPGIHRHPDGNGPLQMAQAVKLTIHPYGTPEGRWNIYVDAQATDRRTAGDRRGADAGDENCRHRGRSYDDQR